MQKVDYTTSVEIPLEVMWDFIKDFSNWAPMLKGYQSHELINDKESIWIIKGEFGSFSRVSKFHTTITEWVQREKVAFELKGLNEPVKGFGFVQLSPENAGSKTNISAQLGVAVSGALGPLIDRMVKPWVRTIAEELVTKLVAAVPRTAVAEHAPSAPPEAITPSAASADVPSGGARGAKKGI
ncbi:MAG: CoxG family protein [Terriglobales bacterium]